MTATYAPGSGSLIHDVRLLIGDTNVSDPYLQDEEIGWFLNEEGGNKYLAAAACCFAVASQSAGAADSKTVGDLTISQSGAQHRWFNMAKRFKARAAMGAMPSVGSLSMAYKAARADDNDMRQPDFTIGMTDNAGTAATGEDE